MSNVLIYQKNDIFIPTLGGVDSSCWQGKTDDEALIAFAKEGYTCKIIDELTYQALLAPTLTDIQQNKLLALSQYYASDVCWTFTLYSASLKATLTKTQSWFLQYLPFANGQIFQLYTDANVVVNYNLSNAEYTSLTQNLAFTSGLAIKMAYINAQIAIKTLIKIDDVRKFNIEGAFSGINRIIKLQN